MILTNPCSRSWTRYPSGCVLAQELNWCFGLFFFFKAPGHELGRPVLGQVLGWVLRVLIPPRSPRPCTWTNYGVGPGSCVKVFFLALAQVPHLSLPTFGLCNTMQLYILVVAQKFFFLKEIEDFIKHSCRAKEYRRIDKDSRDHRMPFYRGLLRRKKKKKTK